MKGTQVWWGLVALVVLVLALQQYLVWRYRSHEAHGSSKTSLMMRGSRGGSGGVPAPPQLHKEASIKDSLHGEYHQQQRDARSIESEARGEVRVAVLIPYTGEALPSWFDTWMQTAAASAPLFDWFIFITDAPLRPTPSNVKLVRVSLESLARRVAKMDENLAPFESHPAADSEGREESAAAAAAKRLGAVVSLLSEQPYTLVELKPALGFLFQDIVRPSYSHWAFADVDQLVGRLDLLMPANQLRAFDVVTAGFGDNYRFYMRGQLTVHKDRDFVSNLWRECTHLSEINARLARWVKTGHWNFVSAEGCYSRVVAHHAEGGAEAGAEAGGKGRFGGGERRFLDGPGVMCATH